MEVVLEAVHRLTPRAKPLIYARRWWTADLTQLRERYTGWRNRARTVRRAGQPDPYLQKKTKEASKEYHDAIRKQKKAHWQDFLAEDINIWQAVRYASLKGTTAFDKLPPLQKEDGLNTEGGREQAEELLKIFFPPLPTHIEDEGLQAQARPIETPRLSEEEIERRIIEASPWKAPGDDGLPIIIWRQVWPVVKAKVRELFQTSLDEGVIPKQWRNAKIIPLKKPNKEDYTRARAWRPILLLATLGKILEAVVAERISYLVEEHNLLPGSYFGARKKRSTEQVLIVLQESIYKAWKSRKVLSLISFDIKGAYNGVYKKRLIQRLKARGIPETLTK